MKKTKNPNRDLSQNDVAARLTLNPEAQKAARRVGAWIWIEFSQRPDKPTRTFLTNLGFHWNRKRSAWQHPCGRPSQRARSYDPRDKYDVTPLTEAAA